jgi:hypothetical protein
MIYHHGHCIIGGDFNPRIRRIDVFLFVFIFNFPAASREVYINQQRASGNTRNFQESPPGEIYFTFFHDYTLLAAL